MTLVSAELAHEQIVAILTSWGMPARGAAQAADVMVDTATRTANSTSRIRPRVAPNRHGPPAVTNAVSAVELMRRNRKPEVRRVNARGWLSR